MVSVDKNNGHHTIQIQKINKKSLTGQYQTKLNLTGTNPPRHRFLISIKLNSPKSK